MPYEYLKEEIAVRYSTQSVEIYHHHRLIATHPRLRRVGETSTLDEHMPSNHEAAKAQMNPQRLRSWAANIGEQSSLFVEAAFDAVEHSPVAYRHIVAVLSLAKLYGTAELELALMYALEGRTIKTKSVRSILDKRLYLAQSANNAAHTASLFDNHTNLRGPDEYK